MLQNAAVGKVGYNNAESPTAKNSELAGVSCKESIVVQSFNGSKGAVVMWKLLLCSLPDLSFGVLL